MSFISVAGSTGFIGSRFCEMYADKIVRIPRESRQPETNEVLNFISTTHNYNIFEDTHLDIDTNVGILIELLDQARKRFGSDFTFNHISTWSVYGKVDLPAKEDAYCNPTGFYSITKRTAEQMLMAYSRIFGNRYRIFRLCNVLGEADRVVPKKKNALQYLVNELKQNKDIDLYHNGNFYREYMYVDDVCRAVALCVEKAEVNEIYNIGCGEAQVFGDLIHYCAKKLGSTSTINRIEPSGFHDIVQAKDMYLDVTKIKALGFEPEFSIYDALDLVMEGSYLTR